jgi:hypothetical protein
MKRHLEPEEILTDRNLHDLKALDAAINAILPPEYDGRYCDVSPQSMGSAQLKFGRDGRVAWEQMWTTFCDLALAGGPPHRGALLGPAAPEVVDAEPQKYAQVVGEIERGIRIVTGLAVRAWIAPGWVGVVCQSEQMAAWLLRAVLAENVSARRQQTILYLPAGPFFRLEKEIKNVITVMAKTAHYWSFHISSAEQSAAKKFAADDNLLEPASAEEIAKSSAAFATAASKMTHFVRAETGLESAAGQCAGWVGFQCADEAMAVWLMRAFIVDGVLARREGNLLYVPIQVSEPHEKRLTLAVARAWRLWQVQRALNASQAIQSGTSGI